MFILVPRFLFDEADALWLRRQEIWVRDYVITRVRWVGAREKQEQESTMIIRRSKQVEIS